jgi:molybdate transport system ATP-binding protein
MSLIVHIEKKLGRFTLTADFESHGTVLGMLGESGCGKSMTLKCIAGVVTPDRGKIILNDRILFDKEKKINLSPQQRQVGFLFQNYALFPHMTVRRNILCGLHQEKDRLKKERILHDVIELLQLQGLETHRPAQLSGGQQQRTALARILVSEPQLLMLDEPFSALDSHLREHLQIELKKVLTRFGKDTLFVTHSRDEAYHLCPEIALWEHGKILTQQPTKKLFANPQSKAAALLTGCKNVVSARKIGDFEVEIADWGIRLTTVEKVKPDLKSIGIRAHYFNPKCSQNRFPIALSNEMEGPFEYILQFRYLHQDPLSPAIWWRIPKEKKSSHLPQELGIAAANILLLYN